jgi:ATP-dependent Clp protease protease subunit
MLERVVRTLALAAAALACASVAWFVVRVLGDLQAPYELFQSLVDAQVEGGAPPAALDATDPLLARRTIVVTSSINEHAAAHVIPRLHYLSALDPAAPIELFVTTTGGWRDSAFAIIDTMRLIDAPVNTTAVGGCYSAGTLVVAGGTGTRAATADALLMLHANLQESDAPYAQESRELARERRFWRIHARLPETWRLDADESYYLTATEAKALGIVDVVREPRPR